MSDSNGSHEEILDKLTRSQRRLALLEAEMNTNKKLMFIVTVLAVATVLLNRCR